ncbi:ABC transporter permease [Streptomyces sp. WMMC905]|uniref:ABC transporter permease n=1 Tax=Streptomyces sp. WMMC905 TaxID=3404123 RepID=UPI003B93614F
MSTTTPPAENRAVGAPGAGSGSTAGAGALVGTGSLFRFALRRDRLRLAVWMSAVSLGTLAVASNFRQLYADPEDRADAAEALGSPAGLAMSGPRGYLDEYTFGAMLGQQMLGFTAVLVGLMSVLIVTRHTRAEEETGRAELVRSAVVGRHAHLAAALAAAVVANLGVALLLALGLPGLGIDSVDASGSLLYGASHAAVGVAFAGVAAITVQLTEHSRGATGMALATIGVAYVLRAAGDSGGNEALSWLSPIGWAQRTYVYVDDRWWPVFACLATAALCAAAGFALSTRRDVGAGLRPRARGAAYASSVLLTSPGLAFRVHRGALLGFGAGLTLMAAMYGAILGQASDLLQDVDQLREALDRLGGAGPAEAFASMVLMVLAVVAAVAVVSASLRPRAEELAGRAEPLLATGLSRDRWLAGHLVMPLVGGPLLLTTAGLVLGLTGAASTGDPALVVRLTVAALAYAPALWVTAGVAVALFGWFPRVGSLVWIVPVYAFVVGYLGEILRFPGWSNTFSPLGHVPRLPSAEAAWTPLVVLTLVAVALVWTGLVGFRRRDLTTR